MSGEAGAAASMRVILDEKLHELETRLRVPPYDPVRAHAYITSNNITFQVVANILFRSDQPVPENWVFDNGTVLCIKSVTSGYTVSMIHPNPVSNEKRFISCEAFNEVLKTSDHKHLEIPSGNIVYLVRHGQALHNLTETSAEDARDAILTDIGIEQAVNSGKATAIHALEHGVSNLQIFCSDLVRTMITADEFVKQFPDHLRPKVCKVCIEAHESIRAIGGKHHWQQDSRLRRIANNPYATIDQLGEIAPGKSVKELERLRDENFPRNNPIENRDECIRRVGDLELDWSDYIRKLTQGKELGMTFGDVASETLFLDVIINNSQEYD